MEGIICHCKEYWNEFIYLWLNHISLLKYLHYLYYYLHYLHYLLSTLFTLFITYIIYIIYYLHYCLHYLLFTLFIIYIIALTLETYWNIYISYIIIYIIVTLECQSFQYKMFLYNSTNFVVDTILCNDKCDINSSLKIVERNASFFEIICSYDTIVFLNFSCKKNLRIFDYKFH